MIQCHFSNKKRMGNAKRILELVFSTHLSDFSTRTKWSHKKSVGKWRLACKKMRHCFVGLGLQCFEGEVKSDSPTGQMVFLARKLLF